MAQTAPLKTFGISVLGQPLKAFGRKRDLQSATRNVAPARSFQHLYGRRPSQNETAFNCRRAHRRGNP